MPSYPKELFYEVTTSHTQYQQEATSSLSIDRLLKGNNAYWVSPSLHKAPKKKKLILADWSANSWTQEKLGAVQKKIQQLTDDGFDIDLSQNDKLIPLSSKNIHLLNKRFARYAITPQTPEEIQVLTGISLEKFLILDDYWVKQLLSGKEQMEPRVLSSYEFHSTRHIVNHYLSQAQPTIELIANDYFKGTSDTPSTMGFPGIPQEHQHCRSLKIHQKIITQIVVIAVNDPPIKYAKNYSATLLISQDLERIQFEGCTVTNGVLTALEKTSQLNAIYLNNSTIEGTLLLREHSLSHLEEINLCGTILSPESLTALLLSTNQLKKLCLAECKEISSLMSLPKGYFSQLEELELRNTEIAPDYLIPILLECPRLQRLRLEACTAIDHVMALPQNYFKELIEINLGSSHISSEGISALLQATPQVKKFELTRCLNIAGLIDLPPDSLLELEEIDLSKSNISLQSFISLIKAAPHLRAINIDQCEQLTNARVPRGFLAKLEKLTLNTTQISLLETTPYLVELGIIGKLEDPITDELTLQPTFFPNLKQIYLSHSYISSLNFTTLLLSAPKLKVLEVHEWYQEEELGDLPLNCLNELEALNLRSYIYPSTLIQILLAAPNLKELNLLYAHDIKDIKEVASLIHQVSPTQQELLNSALFTALELECSGEVEEEESFQRKITLDADTSAQNRHFRVQRVFYSAADAQDPPVSCYRIDVFNTTELNSTPCSPDEAFSMSHEGDLKLFIIDEIVTAHPEPTPNDPPFYIGYCTKLLSHQWEPLPSLSPNEMMYSFQSNANSLIELAYSEVTSLYYVRLKQPTNQIVSMEYTVQVPNENMTLPAPIQSVANFFLDFGCQSLTKDNEYYTGEEYLDAILDQKTGACRHRAFGFKHCLENDFPDIPVRIITNQCHAFVELYIDNSWCTVDLGGYPAQLEVIESRPQSLTKDQNKTNIKEIVEFKKLLQTWDRDCTTSALLPYLQQCVNGCGNNRLIELSSQTQANGLRYELDRYCKAINRPFFYIHTPDELVCTAPTMRLDNKGNGVIQPAPCGALHDFLTHYKEGVLLVNYSQFAPEDLVRLNALIDKTRLADGTPVPEQMAVIGLLSKSAILKPGGDFYSRFDWVEDCPVEESHLTESLQAMPLPGNSAEHSICLYHSTDWKAKLVGRWAPRNGQWLYEEGCLRSLLAELPEHATLTIQKGLWEDPEFCHFWQDALQQGEIKTPSGPILLPNGLVLNRNEDYDWQLWRTHFAVLAEAPEHYVVLNSSTYSQLLNRYAVNDHHLDVSDGLIKEAAKSGNTSLTLYLTHSLNENQWAELLHSAEQYKINLQVYCTPSASLPDSLNGAPAESPGCEQPGYIEMDSVRDFIIIESTDVEVTVAQRLIEKPTSLVIDVSELSPSDLLTKINVRLVQETAIPHFVFTETPCVLNTAKQPIILKGNFSIALAETLAPLLIKKPPHLTLISKDTSLLAYSSARAKHTVTLEEKTSLLQQLCPEHTEPLASIDEPFVQLMARAQCLQRGEVNTENAWLGYQNITISSYNPQRFDSEQIINATQIAEQFMQERRAAVHAVLANQPYVFLTGLSGVGKSTFVQTELCGKEDRLYAEKEIEQWTIKPINNGYKYLFIDEANLKPDEFTRFEGLYNHPPSILINGTYHELSPQHKVIFAGNPVSYGDERQLASFFKRHGNAVLFQPIPSMVLFDKVIKPSLQDENLFAIVPDLAQPILDIYRFLCMTATKDIPISPRELEMMALLTLSFYKHNLPHYNLIQVTRFIAFQVAKPLVPQEHWAEFHRQFKPTMEQLPTQSQPDALENQTEFYVSPSRREAHSWLNALLTLREDKASFSNDAQKYGGLGGVILEGEPGIGKSELVTSTLLNQHFIEAHNYDAPLKQKNTFYRLPISMPLQEKEALLRKAFDEGAVVVIDEINSSPMMERLINALLMGQTPEGKRPKQPGFFIIGTQNPAHMAGRREMSTALKRRTMTLTLEPYSSKEMEDILLHKGLEQTTAQNLVTAFTEQKSYAISSQLSPIPTFRDLLRVAKKVQKAQEKSESPETEQEQLNYSRDRFFSNVPLSEPSTYTPSTPKSNL